MVDGAVAKENISIKTDANKEVFISFLFLYLSFSHSLKIKLNKIK